MQITLLKARLHPASVTHVERDYEDSCAIDSTLLDAAGIREYEQVQIYNIDNGERFTTYAIRAEHGSGIISLNGAAARKAHIGRLLIICAHAGIDEKACEDFKPRLVYLDRANRITRTSDAIPTQAA